MAETPTPELKTYKGNCHCGAYKFHVQLPEIKSVLECNCSICLKKGYKWVFPGLNPFVVEKGEDGLKGYEFAGKSMVHKFCGVCGTGVLGWRHEALEGHQMGLNVRTLQDVDLWALDVHKYDGAKLEPAYDPPVYKGPEPTAKIEDAKTYTGACHCGAVTMALKTKGPLSEGHEYIQECNCSICSRNGTTLIYPSSSQVSIEGKDKLTSYMFGKKTQAHEFCGTCGVSVYIKKLVGDGGEKFDKCPVNLKCFEGVEWDGIQVKKGDGKNFGEKYVVG